MFGEAFACVSEVGFAPCTGRTTVYADRRNSAKYSIPKNKLLPRLIVQGRNTFLLRSGTVQARPVLTPAAVTSLSKKLSKPRTGPPEVWKHLLTTSVRTALTAEPDKHNAIDFHITNDFIFEYAGCNCAAASHCSTEVRSSVCEALGARHAFYFVFTANTAV